MQTAPDPVEEPSAPGKPAMRLVLHDSSLYLLGNVFSRLVGFLAIPFYASYLSPAQYGLVELVELSTQTVTLALGLQAVGAALSRLFYDQTTREAELAVVSTALIFTGGFSLVVTLLAIAGARPLSLLVFGTAEWATLLQAAFAAMFLSEMIEVVLVYERIRNRARFFLAYTLVTTVCSLSLNVLFIGGMALGVWGFICSKLVVTTVGCTVLLHRARREVGWRWRGAYVPELVRFGAPLIVSAVSYFAIHFADRFFLNASVGLADLGRYALAYRFAFLISAMVGDSFLKGWDATFYRYIVRDDWREQFARVASYLVYVLFATGMAITLFSPEVLRLMVPTDYLPPPLLLPVLIAAYVVREVGDFFKTLLLINKRVRLVGLIAFCGMLLNLGLNAVLIPAYGLYGAAAATSLTWGVLTVACWTLAQAEHRLPIRLGAYAAITVLALAVVAVADAVRTGPWLLQVALDGVWLLLFCGLAFAVFFDRTERRGALDLLSSCAAWLARARGAARA